MKNIAKIGLLVTLLGCTTVNAKPVACQSQVHFDSYPTHSQVLLCSGGIFTLNLTPHKYHNREYKTIIHFTGETSKQPAQSFNPKGISCKRGGATQSLSGNTIITKISTGCSTGDAPVTTIKNTTGGLLCLYFKKDADYLKSCKNKIKSAVP